MGRVVQDHPRMSQSDGTGDTGNANGMNCGTRIMTTMPPSLCPPVEALWLSDGVGVSWRRDGGAGCQRVPVWWGGRRGQHIAVLVGVINGGVQERRVEEGHRAVPGGGGEARAVGATSRGGRGTHHWSHHWAWNTMTPRSPGNWPFGFFQCDDNPPKLPKTNQPKKYLHRWEK